MVLCIHIRSILISYYMVLAYIILKNILTQPNTSPETFLNPVVYFASSHSGCSDPESDPFLRRRQGFLVAHPHFLELFQALFRPVFMLYVAGVCPCVLFTAQIIELAVAPAVHKKFSRASFLCGSCFYLFMQCIHVDVESTIEVCSGVIEKKEALAAANEVLVCDSCSDAFSVEVCLECGRVFCRVNGHLEKHWQKTCHRNYLDVSSGAVACEECASYITISEVKRMMAQNQAPVPAQLYVLNTNWVKGFLNLHRTSRLSSVLQVLLSSPLFLTEIFKHPHASLECPRQSCFRCAVSSVVFQMYNNEDPYVNIADMLPWSEKAGPNILPPRCSSPPCPAEQMFGEIMRLVSAEKEELLSSWKQCPLNAHPFAICCASSPGEAPADTIYTHLFSGRDIPGPHCRPQNRKPELVCYFKHPGTAATESPARTQKSGMRVKSQQAVKVGTCTYSISSFITTQRDAEERQHTAYIRRHTQWYSAKNEDIQRVTREDILKKEPEIIFYKRLPE